MRIVVASEHARTLGLVADMVEEEPGVVVVGEARNAIETFGLVEGLKPDIVVIDSDLPYAIGLNATALSRVSGLDTAQALAENMPATPVVLLSNLANTQTRMFDDSVTAIARHARPGDDGATIIRFSELAPVRVGSRSPIFAEIDSGAEPAREKSDEISEGSMILGGAGVLGGAYLIA
ncbi:MAG: hypothetical protein V3S10_04925, partial [Dehalococcoidales bacterium]